MIKRKIVRIFVFLMAMGIIICGCEENLSPEKVGNISGIVRDAEDNSPIAGVSITTTPGTNALITDNSGSYLISDVLEGDYIVKAAKLDYQNASVSVAVKDGETTTADITMKPEDIEAGQAVNPNPPSGATDQPTEVTLSWSSPVSVGSITYDVYFGDGQSPVDVVSVDQEDTSFVVSDLTYNTTYHWQIIVRKGEAETYGPVWNFSTEPIPNNRIVFTSNREGDFEVYSCSTDSADLQLVRLTDEPSRDWWPRYNPNREKIAFSSDRSVEPHIYLMDKDGTDVKKITTVPITGYNNYGIGFCWAWTGYQLFYSHNDKLYRIDDDGSHLTQIAVAPDGLHFREVDCSPLGDKLVVLGIGNMMYDTVIYLMNTNGSDARLFVDHGAGTLGHPSFSPDGSKIVYSWDVSGHQVQSGRQFDARIFVINIDGTGNTDISRPSGTGGGKPNGTNDLNPVWSPDGASIIFTNSPNDDSAPPEIWIMDIDGGSRRKLLTDGTMPDWR